jgi:hypothetical protein
MTIPPGRPPQRAVESAFWFGEHLKCDVTPQGWEREIEQRDAAVRAAERAPLEARIAELECSVEAWRIMYKADCKPNVIGDLSVRVEEAEARAQRAREDALEEAAQAVERIGPRVSGDAIRALATHRTATGGQAE